MRHASLLVGLFTVLVVGCAAPTQSDDSTPTGVTSLAFTQRSEGAVVGSLPFEAGRVQFSSRQVSAQVFSVEVLYDGVTLTADMDYTKKQVRLDGFATANGQDTVLNDKDKLVIAALGDALSKEGLSATTRDPAVRGVEHQTAGSAMVRALSMWNTSPVNAKPQREVKAVVGRTITQLCGYISSGGSSQRGGYGIGATHDCWWCWDNWDGWSWVNIGPEGTYNCYPDSCGRTNGEGEGSPLRDSSACSNRYTNKCNALSCEDGGGGASATWQWGSDGDKYGACTVWDSNAYTYDCLNHDHCVRNNHITGSGWCSDEAVYALDDQPFAANCPMQNGCAGRCGTTGSQGGCWCDSACTQYGDCCSDKVISCGE